MQIGDIVKFKEVIERGDELIRMEILEINGDRAYVRDLAVNMVIQPTHTYPIDQLENCDRYVK